MKVKLILAGVLLAGALVLAGCAQGTEDTAGLEDMTWVLESYGEPDNLQAVIAGTEVTAIFESADSRVSGLAGCNNYSGGYELSGNKLSMPLIAVTEMYCVDPEGVNEQERQYLNVLTAAETHEVVDGELRITGGSQVLIFNAR